MLLQKNLKDRAGHALAFRYSRCLIKESLPSSDIAK